MFNVYSMIKTNYFIEKKAKKVLVGPWIGELGHITGTIPIIEKLIERGHDVHTCGNEIAKKLYKVFPISLIKPYWVIIPNTVTETHKDGNIKAVSKFFYY